jgi:hypothetical protein
LVDGPTVQEWFNSITAPEFMEGEYGEGEPKERKSDLLSPPPGQRTKREGLGAYNLASDTIPFFELRDFMSSQSQEKPRTLHEIHMAALKLLQIEETLSTETETQMEMETNGNGNGDADRKRKQVTETETETGPIERKRSLRPRK